MKSRRQRHKKMLDDLLRFGWKVELCYVRSNTRWCNVIISWDNQHRFIHEDTDMYHHKNRTSRTPPFKNAERDLTFVVVPYGSQHEGEDGHVVRTWSGLEKFTDEARSKWITTQMEAGYYGEQARRTAEATKVKIARLRYYNAKREYEELSGCRSS